MDESNVRYAENVQVTIKRVFTTQEGQLDVKKWGKEFLQRCLCTLADGRELQVRIGADGLQAGAQVILPKLRSWPNQYRQGEFLHAADTATTLQGQTLAPIDSSPPTATPTTPAAIPGGPAASPPAGRPSSPPAPAGAPRLNLQQAQDAVDKFTACCWDIALMRSDNPEVAAAIFPTILMTAKCEAGLWEHYARLVVAEPKREPTSESEEWHPPETPDDNIPF